MTEEQDWAAARLRELAEGEYRHYRDRRAPRNRARSSLLRRFARVNAVLDIGCRGGLLARIFDDPDRGLMVAWEAVPEAHQPAPRNEHHRLLQESGSSLGAGIQLMTLPLTDVPISVACRCGESSHVLDPQRVRYAIAARPTKVLANVEVSRVAGTGLTY